MLNAVYILKAVELAEAGLRHEPQHEHCLYVIALTKVIYYGQVNENAELCALISHHPERVRSAYALVVALRKKGKFREAYRVSQQMLRAQPDSPEWLENVRTFKLASHWSMLPLYPFQRWGLLGASLTSLLGVCLILAMLVQIFPQLSEAVKLSFVLGWLAYSVYSWIWPPMLRDIIDG